MSSMYSTTSRVVIGIALCAIGCTAIADDVSIRFARRPDVGKNAYAVGNRPPLTPSAFFKLPIGAIRPEGWVRKQLKLEADGFTGHLTEISPWLNKKNNAWLSPTGQGDHGFEEVPYWLKGFGDLGYILRDGRIENETKTWIEAVIHSQRPNGYFGPESNLTANNGHPDVWPNMVMLCALQSYYEYSGDKRVLDLMNRYFQWELTVPDPDFLLSYWEPQRAGDNIASVIWLYNRTGNRKLLDLVEKLNRRGARWDKGVPNWHGVNMAQGFRTPAEVSTLTHDPGLIDATEQDYETMRRDYGQVPGGMYGADENCRPGYGDPRQATETCAMVEMMLSDEMLLGITGDPTWAERCEDVAFNSFPASMTPDLKALHYLTSPNMVLIDAKSRAPELQNGGPMLLFNPYDHRCCQHNVSHGWPYYAEHLWLGSADNGLAVALYAPSRVTASAGSGHTVSVTEQTEYPFDEDVKFSFQMSGPNRFPLTLRWPGWCRLPFVTVNGHRLRTVGSPGGYLIVTKTWKNGDLIDLRMPMEVRTQSWTENKGSVSVERGPLTYSLKIGERFVRNGGTDKFPAYEVHPTTPWNYGLETGFQAFTVVKKAFPADNQPFTPNSAPIEIIAKARKIPEWQVDRLGLVGLLQDSPAESKQPEEKVELVPMGATRLRISAFPTVSDGARARKWIGPPPMRKPVPTQASHTWVDDSVDAMSDGLTPKSSDDQSVPRFTWWDHRGTREWVEYDFAKPLTASQVQVYWFDDAPTGGGCRVPASWTLLYKVGSSWKPVTGHGPFETQVNAFNRLSFDPVSANSFRIRVQLQPGYSGGILQWEIK